MNVAQVVEIAGYAAAFFALTVVFGLLLPGRGKSERALEEALHTYARGTRLQQRTRKLDSLRVSLAALRSHKPKRERKDLEQTVGHRLELAGWPLRATEFVGMQAVAAAAALGAGAFLLGKVLPAIIFAAAAWTAPRLLLARTIDRRSEDFIAQLPDTLQLLASSLEAGYSLLQGMDAVVKEAGPPTSTEFGRAVSEIQIGSPAHEALTAMAERVGRREFAWVVLAMNIQREVGGNLATLLKTVADTLREREQLRRQVKVLSAEGRISALILGLLPVALTLYMAVVNPSYLGVLFHSFGGRVLLIGAVLLIGTGALWMRKLVRLEV